VAVICVVVAYPTAWLLSRLDGFWLTVALYCVLVPFWISVLVRTFSWMLLLERNGPLNAAISWVVGSQTPLKLLFNDFGVHIGMVHVLLPYAVLPIYAAMLKVDNRLLLASDGLGASGSQTFWHIYLPLTARGVAAGAIFVFLLALGFYITPALLGGGKTIMVAEYVGIQMTTTLRWGVATALCVLLLVAVLLAVGAMSRLMSMNTLFGGAR
jgi:putative spermidine/putrescine transport system permease protein